MKRLGVFFLFLQLSSIVCLAEGVTLEKTKTVLEGEDWQAKVDYLVGLQSIDPREIPNDVQVYIIEDYFKLYDIIHSRVQDAKYKLSILLGNKSYMDGVRLVEQTVTKEMHNIMNWYQPDYVDRLIFYHPAMVPAKTYGRLKVDAMTKDLDAFIKHYKDNDQFSYAVIDVMKQHKKGKLHITPEEKKLFKKELTKKLNRLASLPKPCDRHHPQSVIKALYWFDLPELDKQAFKVMDKCVKGEIYSSAKMEELRIMVDYHLPGTDKVLQKQIKNEKDEDVLAYLQALLSAFENKKSSPNMSIELAEKLLSKMQSEARRARRR